MRSKKSRGHAALIAAAVAAVGGFSTERAAWGAGVFTYSTAGSNYSQTFSSLTQSAVTLSGTGAVDLADGTGPIGGSPAMDGWWYQSSAGDKYIVNGSQSTATSSGALYNFFDSSGNQSLGLQATSGTGNEVIGMGILNSTGETLTNFTLSYDGELWHYGNAAGASKSLSFGYEVAANGSALPDGGSGAIPTGTTAVSALTYGPISNPSPDTFSTGGEYEDGASSPAPTALNNGAGTSVTWANNQVLWLTWTMASGAQSPGLGLADLVFNATAGGGTPVLDWDGGGANSTTWNTAATNENWKVSPADTVASAYADPDVVNFTPLGITAGGSAVAVVAGGVNPTSVTINNTSGKYTFTGGSIGGSGALTMNGAGGSAELSNTNSYSGGTNFEAGTLIADSDGALGTSTGGLTIEGGTFQTGGNITSSARSINVSTAGGTIDTPSTDNFTTSGSSSISGTLSVNGAATTTLNGAVTFGTAGALDIGSGETVTFGQATGTITQSNNSTYNGNLVLSTAIRYNFNSASATLGGNVFSTTGAGQIEVTAPETTAADSFYTGTATANTNLVTTAYITNQKSTEGADVDVPIVLNPSGSNTRGDVTQQYFSPGSFTVTIGGTTGGDGIILGSAAVISGNSDVNIANSPLGGGAGSLALDAASTYNGTTTINAGGSTITEGVTNALPANTDLIVGTIGNGALGLPVLDLHGFNQTVNSLSDGQYSLGPNTDAPGQTSAAYLTITNANPGTTSTFTVSGSTTPWEDTASASESGYQGVITDGSASAGPGNGVLNFVKGGSSTLVLNNTYYTGTTTVTGGTLQINDPVTLINDSSASNIVADGAGSGNSHPFGATLIRQIAGGATYDDGDGGSTETDGLGSQESGDLGTKADILLGTNSSGSPVNVSMQWRQRNTNETPGTATFPPSDPGTEGLISDVVNVTGMSESDPYVLQMTYTISGTTAAAVADGLLKLDYLSNPNTENSNGSFGQWENAVLGDIEANGSDTNSGTEDFKGSFATFALDKSITDANVANYLGSWGVDDSAGVGNQGTVWAVIDHDSQFAVVPEPSTALIGLGIAGFGMMQRRRRRSQLPTA